jgi:hypothetical protein
MPNDLNNALLEFHHAIVGLRESLRDFPEVRDQLLAGSEDWESLLRFKLLPQGAEPDCVVVAMGGGTNTGKSTLFNLLAGSDISPVRCTAAATCRPVVAANPNRAADCYAGHLMPGFEPQPFTQHDDPLIRNHPPQALFVAEAEALPMSRVLLDTPDVDSIDLANWETAARLRASGDVVLAVLTGEKYQDERVVAFFREAAASGRMVLPIMNKANPDRDYEVARAQLETFCISAGIEGAPLFAAPHNFDLMKSGGAEQIIRLDEPGTLPGFLDALDAVELKLGVLALSAARFVEQAGEVGGRISALADTLHAVADGFEGAACRFALRYQPAPGTAVGGLFHQFVQNKRGPVDRAIGSASKAIAKGAGYAGKAIRNAVASRTLLQPPQWEYAEDKVRGQNLRQIEQLTSELAAHYLEQARTLAAPADHLAAPFLESMDIDGVTARVARSAEQNGGISDDFREHAERTLELWWHDNRGKRMVIEALDKVLLVAPAGIAGVISVQTAGVGVPEALIIAGPVMEQFAARVMEYQFGDAMFDFISPWRKDQQEAFERALREHLAHPVLEPVQRVLDAIEERHGAQIKRSLEACRAALETC